MSTSATDAYHEIARRRRLDGLSFGMLSGLVFALAAWGLDAAALASASVEWAWFKLLVGGILTVLIGGLIGWIVAVIDHGLAGLIGWILAGIAFGWLAGRLPFQGMSVLGGLLDPRLKDVTAYPFYPMAEGRANAATVLVAALAAFAGIFELLALDQARAALTRIGRWVALVMFSPFLIFAGGVSDSINNRQLREPQVNIVELIRFDLANRGTPIDRQQALDMHLGAIRAIRDMMTAPQSVMLGDYDSFSLNSVSVEIEFDTGWVRCWLLYGHASYCRPINPLYLDGLPCVLRNLDAASEDCRIGVSDSARSWLTAHRQAIGDPVQVMITGRFGAVVWVEAVGEDQTRFECRFAGSQPPMLEACGQVSTTPGRSMGILTVSDRLDREDQRLTAR